MLNLPYRAKRPCLKAGCKNLVHKGYCSSHKKQKPTDNKRANAADRGYDWKWQKARKVYLQSNPLCTECLGMGLIRPADVVDHIIPHRGNKRLFCDESNWQSLCKKHHDQKTGRGG